MIYKFGLGLAVLLIVCLFPMPYGFYICGDDFLWMSGI